MLYRTADNKYTRIKRKAVRGTNQYQVRYSRYQIRKAESQIKSLITVLAIGGMLAYAGHVNIVRYLESRITIISPLPKTVQADTKRVNVSPVPTGIEDERITKLRTYLTEKGSPLAGHSALIIQEADKKDIPWTLITAIAGKESSFGKNIKQGSHNAWGIMSWKNNVRSIRTFASWEEGIKYVSSLLSENYRANMNAGVQAKYCPSSECEVSWVQNVTTFQREINL